MKQIIQVNSVMGCGSGCHLEITATSGSIFLLKYPFPTGLTCGELIQVEPIRKDSKLFKGTRLNNNKETN